MLALYYILAGVALADFKGDSPQVIQLASNLGHLVQAWHSSQGLEGALSIQQSFPSFVEAVNKLDGDIDQLSVDQIPPSSINALSSSIVGLLNALTEKSSEFQGVGAHDIVGNDIRSMQQPAEHLVSGLVSVVTNSAKDQIASYTPALDSFRSSFLSADSAYGLPPPSFPTISVDGQDNSEPASSPENGGSAPSAASDAPSQSAMPEGDGSNPQASGAPNSGSPADAGGSPGNMPTQTTGNMPLQASGEIPPQAPGNFSGNYSALPQANGYPKLAVGIIAAAAAIVALVA